MNLLLPLVVFRWFAIFSRREQFLCCLLFIIACSPVALFRTQIGSTGPVLHFPKLKPDRRDLLLPPTFSLFYLIRSSAILDSFYYHFSFRPCNIQLASILVPDPLNPSQGFTQNHLKADKGPEKEPGTGTRAGTEPWKHEPLQGKETLARSQGVYTGAHQKKGEGASPRHCGQR